VTWARIVQGERALSRDGVLVDTEHGVTKNPWTTVLNQYRAHFRSLVGELGLTPSSASRLNKPQSDDDDDPFD
jgi:P27 family predicted phage terminase small subunit